MGLLDKLQTDIKSFDYNKVGQKHDEYFGEDKATGFTPNRQTKSPSEFTNDATGDYNFSGKQGYPTFNTQKPYTIDREPGNETEFIIGSGGIYNFTQKQGFQTFDDTAYLIDREPGNETEFIFGSGGIYNFIQKQGFQTFGDKPYLIDREPGNETEFVFGSGGIYNFTGEQGFQTFGDRPYTINRKPGEDTVTEFIIGSGGIYNFKEPQSFATFNINGNGFQLNQNPGNRFVDGTIPETEFGDGGNSFYSRPAVAFKAGFVTTNMFSDANAKGFTANRTEQDLETGEFIIGSGGIHNFKEPQSFATFNPSGNGFQLNQNPGNRFLSGIIPETEFGDGGSSYYSRPAIDFDAGRVTTDFFTDGPYAKGFTANRTEQDLPFGEYLPENGSIVYNFFGKQGYRTFKLNGAVFQIDQNPGNRFVDGVLPETELGDYGISLYSSPPAFFKGGFNRTDFFSNVNATGFTPNRDAGNRFEGGVFQEVDTEYIIGSGNFTNFTEPRGFATFNLNGKKFKINQDPGNRFGAGVSLAGVGLPDTEFGDGASSNYSRAALDFDKGLVTTDFFLNKNAKGFTANRTEQDLGVEKGFAGEYVIGSSRFDDINKTDSDVEITINGIVYQDKYYTRDENNTVIQTYNEGEEFSTVRRTNVLGLRGETFLISNKTIGVNFTKGHDYINVENAISSVSGVGSTRGETLITTSPNMQTGYVSPFALNDRYETDVKIEYNKFGGFDGSRAGGTASNMSPGAAFGSDQPYILKKIGESDYTTFDEGIMRGGVVLNALRTVDDVLRVGKFMISPKGLLWNGKQFLLQAMSARKETRLFNPLGPIGSIIPMFHLPRHFTFPNALPSGAETYQEQPEANKNHLGSLLNPGSHFEKNRQIKVFNQLIKDDIDFNQPGTLSRETGLSNTAFTEPQRVVRSTKGSLEQDIGFQTENGQTIEDKHPTLITKYTDLTKYRSKTFGQSDVQFTDTGEVFHSDGEEHYDTKMQSTVSTITDVGRKAIGKASEKSLGRGLVKTSIADSNNNLYSVGVSNQLQVPYGGKFADLNYAVGTPGNTLPKDFVKFRIRDAVNGKWLIFPAHLGTITDTVTPEYTKERYIGRPDEVHIYNGATRAVSFDFRVAAFTKQEIPIIQEKMNYLIGLGYPTYKKHLIDDNAVRPVTPYIYLTIGDLYNNTPGYFDNITITMEENSVWEIDDGFQIPQYFQVSVNFIHINKTIPTTISKHYDVPHLTDVGVSDSKFGTFGETDPRIAENTRPTVDTTNENNKWATSIV